MVQLTSAEGLQPGPISLIVDGKATPGRVGRDAASARWEGEAALGLARALAIGQSAIVMSGEKPLGSVSLAGATAAMLFVDETQARVGTKAALARPGRRTDASVAGPRPKVLPYPGLRTAPAPATLAAQLRQRGVLKGMDCDAGQQPTDAVHPLDATHTLVLLECGSGAYNLVQRPFLLADGRLETARLADGEPGEGIVNADFDPRSRTLGGLNKGRGIGDCGRIDRWAWTGKAFVKVQTTVMDVCRGVPPEWWITTERSELAVPL